MLIVLRKAIASNVYPTYSNGVYDGKPMRKYYTVKLGTHEHESYTCAQCGKQHDKLYLIVRKVRDMFGHFPVVMLNGQEHVIDITLPTTVDKIPRDAVAVPDAIASKVWHWDSHRFVHSSLISFWKNNR